MINAPSYIIAKVATQGYPGNKARMSLGIPPGQTGFGDLRRARCRETT